MSLIFGGVHHKFQFSHNYLGSFHLHFRYVVQILVHSHFEQVSSLLDLDATEPVFQPVTQMAVDLINIHLISVQQKR